MDFNLNNLLLNTDSYKVSMPAQYPDGIDGIYFYIESRGGDYDQVVFFGLQAFIKQWLTTPITRDNVQEAAMFYSLHGEPFDTESWMYIVDHCNGFMPITISALPEGTKIGTKNVLCTVECTDKIASRLVTHLETALLRAIWYPTTVATRSNFLRGTIKQYLEDTGDVTGLEFKLHDFGARGVSSFDSAGLGAAAHLVNFNGTDTVTGVLYAHKFYNAGICGFSIPAAEHSTITSWGRDREADAYRNMVTQFGKPGAVFAVVSDSYDIFNACENIWGTDLKDIVVNSGSTLVIRPDSGDPEYVVMKVLDILAEKFGYTVNDKGYKVLNNVRIIQGDGVCDSAIRSILSHMKIKFYSADNVAFGMGGQLLQGMTRDTQKFAMKCSAIRIDGEWHDVAKDPVTDAGKRSKAGRVVVIQTGTGFASGKVTGNTVGIYDASNNVVETLPYTNSALRTVYQSGALVTEYTFDQIRKLARQ